MKSQMNKLITGTFTLLLLASPLHAAQFSGFHDTDWDGALDFPNSGNPARASVAVGGYFLANDCDWGDASTSPYATEFIGDGVDSNCSGYEDDPEATLLMPSAQIDSATAVIGSDLQLDASSSTSGNGAITFYHWFLDDSGQAILSTSNATDSISWATLFDLGYSEEGSYNLGLIIEDEANALGYNFTPATFEITAVPVPAAAWLFGSGLLGLIGLARKKQA